MTHYQALAEELLRKHPQEAATIVEKHEPEQIAEFAAALGDDEKTRLFMSLEPQIAAEAVRHLPKADAIELIGTLPRREASAILRRTPRDRREAYLAGMPAATRLQLEVVLHQSSHRVGAYIETGLLAMSPDSSVEAARRRLRSLEAPVSVVFLVNEKQDLLGSFPVAKLFIAKGSDYLRALADTSKRSLTLATTVEDALTDAVWMTTDVLGVVDREGKLVGSVRYATLRAAAEPKSRLQQEAEEGGDYMRVADNLYVGLAEVLLTSIPKSKANRVRHHSGGDGQ